MGKVIKSFEGHSTAYGSFEPDMLVGPKDPTILEGFEEDGGTAVEKPLDPAEVLAAARTEAERKVKEAYDEGLRRGENRGIEEFRERAGEAAQAFHDAAAMLVQARTDFLTSLEPQVVALVKDIAERVLRRECGDSAELVKTMARAALETLADRERVLLKCNPEDLEVMKAYGPGLIEQIAGLGHVTVEADQSIERGGCIVETPTVQVDATIDGQLQQVLDAL